MALLCLISIAMIRILTIHQKWLSPQLVKVRSDSIPTFTHAERFVCRCWVLGEVVQVKIGIRNSRLFCNCSFRPKVLPWVRMFTSMSQVLMDNKERKKEIKKMRPIVTLWGSEMFDMPWLNKLRTLQKDLRMSFKDISTLSRRRSSNNAKSGFNGQTSDKLHTQVLSLITIAHGAHNLKPQRQNTNNFSKKTSKPSNKS